MQTTNSRLAYEDYVPVGMQLEYGGVMRINHDTYYCGGSSPSLKITKDSYGVVTGRCYRCGRYGKYSKKRRYVKGNTNVPKNKRKAHVLPQDLSSVMSEWPPPARVWIHKARVTQEEVTTAGIGFSHLYNRVVVPIMHGTVLAGFQTRRIFNDDKYPKYLTYANDPEYMWMYLNSTDSNVDSSYPCVVVEDRLSSIRVGRVTKCFCLCGTNMSKKGLNILSNERSVIIYLDDDNSIVKAKQLKLRGTLEMVCNDVRIIRSEGIDPKDKSDDELRRMLLCGVNYQ